MLWNREASPPLIFFKALSSSSSGLPLLLLLSLVITNLVPFSHMSNALEPQAAAKASHNAASDDEPA